MRAGEADFSVRPIRAGDERALLVVEHRASRLLDALGLHDPALPTAEADFVDFLDRHTVQVATVDGEPVGYGAGADLGEMYWLRELAVDPRFARRGIGRALVRAVCRDAAALFHRAVGLTTYRSVPFNAPFHSSCGFLAVSRQQIAPILEERLVAEAPPGCSAASRVAMVKWL